MEKLDLNSKQRSATQKMVIFMVTECIRVLTTFTNRSALPRILTYLCVLPCGLTERPCESPQYLELGNTGLINCSFPDNHLVISWFDSRMYRGQPLIELRNSEKEGRGYLSGEYDILQNGSLVIKNVSLEHEHTFSVVRVDNIDDELIPHYIVVVTIVTPQQQYPYINNCTESSPGIYYAQYHEGTELECCVNDARPAVQLKWAVRTGSGEKNVTHQPSSIEPDGAIYSSHTRLTDPPIPSFSVVLVICRASSQPSLLNENAAFLFLQNLDADLPNSAEVQKYVVQGLTAILNSPKLAGENLLVWNLKKTKAQTQEMIGFAIFGKDNFTSTHVSDDYALADNGSLVIFNAATMHSGTYSCITSNAEREESQIYDVHVYAPASPEVEGCDPNSHCVLHAEEYDSLTCTIRGVLEDVRLEFSVLSVNTPGITFTDSTTTICETGDYYDVSFSTRYKATYSASGKVTIECRVVGTRKELFSDTAVLSLHIDSADVLPTKTPDQSVTSIWMIVALASWLLTVAIIAHKLCSRARSKASGELDDRRRITIESFFSDHSGHRPSNVRESGSQSSATFLKIERWDSNLVVLHSQLPCTPLNVEHDSLI